MLYRSTTFLEKEGIRYKQLTQKGFLLLKRYFWDSDFMTLFITQKKTTDNQKNMPIKMAITKDQCSDFIKLHKLSITPRLYSKNFCLTSTIFRKALKAIFTSRRQNQKSSKLEASTGLKKVWSSTLFNFIKQKKHYLIRYSLSNSFSKFASINSLITGIVENNMKEFLWQSAV